MCSELLSRFQKGMGVIGFYQWLKKLGLIPESVHIKFTDKLLVDVKIFMYRFAAFVESENSEDEFAEKIAAEITRCFRNFSFVTFVNDGKLPEDHPKQQVLHVRSQQKEKAGQRAKRTFSQLVPEEDEEEDKQQGVEEEEQTTSFENIIIEAVDRIEKDKRVARGVSYAASMKILKILQEKHGFNCIQCLEEEADDCITKLASQYTHVLSDDSDFLLRGINLVRGFTSASASPVLFDVQKILEVAKLQNLRQLQTMACFAGCDYFLGGIRGIGLTTAHKLLLKYESLENMLEQWKRNLPSQRADRKKWEGKIRENLPKISAALEVFSN